MDGLEHPTDSGLDAVCGTILCIEDHPLNSEPLLGSMYGALKEAFDKQLVSIKVSDSPDEAKTWLKSELDVWRKITSEVKIDLAE